MISEKDVIDLIKNQTILKNFCRFCLSKSKTKSVFECINNIAIAKKITYCTSITPFENDGLPASICTKCLKELNAADTFKNKCLHAENVLRKIILEEKHTHDFDYKNGFGESKSVILNEVTSSEYIDFDDHEEEGFSNDEPIVDCMKREPLNEEVLVNINSEIVIKNEPFDNNLIDSINLLACLHCDEKLSSERSYKSHLQKVHGIKTKKRKDKCLKKESLKKKHRSSKHRRIEVNKDVQILTDLKHEDEDDFRNDELLSLGNIVGQGQDRVYSCKSCSYQSKRRNQFRYHVRIHTGELPHICDICNRAFRQPSSLNYHKKTHNEKNLHCPSCPKIFYCKQHYVRHLKVHNNEKIAKCPICDKSLKTKATLKVHMDRHKNIRNYGCEICGKNFVTMSELIGHSAKHNDEKKYICDICDFRSKKKTGLQNHIVVTHLGGRPFECEYCDMKFNTKGILKSHMRRHTYEKKYQCSICEARFMHSPSLNKHMLNAHHIKFRWSEVIDRRIVK